MLCDSFYSKNINCPWVCFYYDLKKKRLTYPIKSDCPGGYNDCSEVSTTISNMSACKALCFYMGGVFVGATGYADDLKLLTPSVNALNILVNICQNYAAKYDVMFNGKKSLLIIYKCTWRKHPDPTIYINNVKVPRVNEVIHFGHNLCEDIFKFNASK